MFDVENERRKIMIKTESQRGKSGIYLGELSKPNGRLECFGTRKAWLMALLRLLKTAEL